MSDRFGWRAAIVSGCVWGVVVMLAISLNQPIGDLTLPEGVFFTVRLTLDWSCAGVVWATGVKLAEASTRPLAWLAATLFTATAGSVVLAFDGLFKDGAVGLNALVNSVPLEGQIAYNLWANLIYGGLYAAGYFATRRTLRLRRRLSELTIARSDAEATLREARLAAVRGQVQPAMLLEALDALRTAYALDPREGEELFDRIIAFLRAAMPGLRSGASTLAAELTVVRRYRELEQALPAGRRPWALDLAEPPADLAFPPLRLLPALDRVSRALPDDAVVALRAARAPAGEAEGFVMRIGVEAPRALPSAMLSALRAGLRRDLGLRLGLSDSSEVLGEIRMPLAA